MLADLLVAVAVLSLVMGANLALLEQGQKAYRTGAARVESQQSARIALTRIARDIRTAGSGKLDPSFAQFERFNWWHIPSLERLAYQLGAGWFDVQF